jgi:hypothetical protein
MHPNIGDSEYVSEIFSNITVAYQSGYTKRNTSLNKIGAASEHKHVVFTVHGSISTSVWIY